jgi:hypothetical protein
MREALRRETRGSQRRAFAAVLASDLFRISLSGGGRVPTISGAEAAFRACCSHVARKFGSVRWLLGLGAGLFAGLLAPLALAFPTSRLVYARGPGAEQCPDQSVVRDAVASRLGYDPFFPSSDKTIVARILRDEKGLHGQVELVDEHGAQVGLRELAADADRCDELVRAMALSISIAIDPKSAESYAQGPPDEPETPSKEAAPEPESNHEQPQPAPIEEKARTRSRAAAAAPRALLSAGIGVMGVLYDAPKTTLSGLGFARLRRSSWSLALEARAGLPVIEDQAGVRFRTSSYSLGAVPCLHLGVAFACEVTSLGWLSAKGTEPGGKSGTSTVLSLGARVGAEVMVSPSMGLIDQAEVLLSPWTVPVASGGSTLWHTKWIHGGAGFALAMHFP